MAMTLVLPPEEMLHDASVLGVDGQPVHEFRVFWRTPTDAEKDEIRVARARLADAVHRFHGGAIPVGMTIEEAMQQVIAHKRATADMIRKCLLRADDPAFEAGDIDSMLRYDNYRVGLFASLLDVADGSAARKNALSQDTSGVPESSPVATAQS